MSMKDFLEQPLDSCRTIISLGKPGSGKTYNMLNCLKNYWLPQAIFSEVHLVLPVFKYEQNDSYEFLKNWKGKTKIYVYDGYHPKISERLIKKQQDFITKHGREKAPKLFFGLDDTTHQDASLYKCRNIIEISTTSRHLNIHTWVIMHYNKGVIPPKVRNQINYIFVLQLSQFALEDIYKSYFDFPREFPKFKDFLDYMLKLYEEDEYACLLIDLLHKKYNSKVSEWWKLDE